MTTKSYPPGTVLMRPMLDSLASNWPLILLRGILAILIGLLTFVWPGLTLMTLVLLYGAFAFGDGILSLVAAVSKGAPAPRWWLALVGVIGILAGVVTLLWPGITGFALLYLIAAWAIVSGVLHIVGAIALRKEIDDEWLLIATGVAELIFGGLILSNPGAGALSIAFMIGFFAVVSGGLLVGFALKLRKHAAVKI